MMKRYLLYGTVVFVLSGCVSAKVIVMKDPKTGQIVQCGTTEHGSTPFPIIQTSIDNSSAESCAKGYQAAGWDRMN